MKNHCLADFFGLYNVHIHVCLYELLVVGSQRLAILEQAYLRKAVASIGMFCTSTIFTSLSLLGEFGLLRIIHRCT